MNTKIGTTTIARIKNQPDMDKFVKSLSLLSDHVILKPNWVDGLYGSHTGAKALDMLLTSINRPTTIIESYTFWRTDKMAKGEGDYFSSKEATIKTGIKHWDHFKKQDQWFLRRDGIDKILKKHNIKYLNITNEVWKKKTVKLEIIKKIVEQNYPPVHFQQLYSYVPLKLFSLRNSDLISLSKAKANPNYGPSLSIKNFFGLIPDPNRAPNYHGGPNESDLAKAIIDIHKIYQSIFNVKFLVDGIFTAGFMNWDVMKFIPTKKWGIIFAGNNGLEVDFIGSQLLQQNFKGPMPKLMKQYQKTFGDTTVNANSIPSEHKINLNLK